MAGKQARIDIEAAASRRANDDCDLSAFVEPSNRILGERRATTHQRRQKNENSFHLSPKASAPYDKPSRLGSAEAPAA